MTTTLIIPMPHVDDLGPAMRECTEKERAFVVALYFYGGNHAQAAAAAGYTQSSRNALDVAAHQVYHRERVQRAIKEYAASTPLSEMLPAAMASWKKIIEDDGHKDQAKMIIELANRAGLHAVSEHKLTVEHKDDRVAKIRALLELAKKLGQDPKALLGAATDVTDADFEMLAIEDGREGLEDVL